MKVIYIFKSGRKQRLEGNNVFPDDFYYGFLGLDDSLDKEIIEESELEEPTVNGGKFNNKVNQFFRWIRTDYKTVLRFWNKSNLERLNQADYVVATTNTQGIALGLLKIFWILKPKLIFIAMGVLHKPLTFCQKFFIKLALYRSSTVVISEREDLYLKEKERLWCPVRYMRFGVDTKFWTPGERKKAPEPYFLSMGNDPHRDYPSLLSTYVSKWPKLKIISKLLDGKEIPEGVEVLRGDWRTNLIDDDEIREYLRQSLFVVVPLTDTIQPSGQSVTLQAMACGKAVILAKIEGIWAPNDLLHGENCLFYQPGDKGDLRKHIQILLNDTYLRDKIGKSAYELINSRYSSAHTALDMMETLKGS